MKAHRVVLAGWTPWLLGMAVLAFVAGCSKPAPPPPPVVAAPPPPPPISVESIPPLVVHAGTSGTSRFKIDRAGRVGDVSITVAQPPEGLTVVADKVPAESTSGSIVVKAAESLGEADTETTFSITATLEEATAEQTVTVKVPKFEGPSLTAEEEPTVQPGRKATLRLRVDRKGAPPRPIELAAEAAAAPDQPAESEPGAAAKREISFAATTVAADADVVSLDLDVAAGAKDGPRTIEVFGRTMGRQFPLTFKVDVRGKPYALKLPLALAVAPGAKKTFDLQVERTKYDGPISIAVDNLPDGVAVDAPEIPAGADKAEVTVTASADAAARVRSAILRTTGGPFAASRPLVVRVRPEGSDAWLPDAVKVGRDGKPLKKNVWIGGRLSPEGKQALMDFFGGTPESEAAIVRGLAWLAKMQKEDGSWSLFKDGDPTGEDSKDSATAATAFGILPFLGEGIIPSRAPAATPELENYKAVVEKGLIYLASKQVQDKGRNEGYFGESMYAHCLATIAFCEAFALSGEERVRFHARLGVKYLLSAQDAEGGGWRYSRGQPGDMSVTGWVIVALRTAQLTGISVTSQQLRKARKFVDSCGVGPEGVPRSQYCYVTEKPATPPMTAAGLLSQLYLGWERDEPELAAGRTYLMDNLPPETASTVGRMYYFYYATQVLHHLEGEEFDAWNHLMRDHLVGLQIKDGDLAGSWDPQGVDYGVRAGRMYTTSLALLTLQVYYRHLPIYRIPSTTAQAPAAEGEAEVERPGGAPRGA